MKYKYLLIIILALILSFTGVVKAQTIDNLELITKLEAEIAQLSAQLAQLKAIKYTAPISPTMSTWCYTFTNNLKIGDKGKDVKELQTVLLKENLFYGSITGTFWEKTESAVIKFQEKYASDILNLYGLTKGTGYVGPLTIKKLNMLYACGTNN